MRTLSRKRNSIAIHILFGSVSLFSNSWAMAFMPQDPVTTGKHNSDLSPTLTLSEITYDPERGDEFDIERQILGFTGSFGVGSQTNLDLSLGLIMDTEVDNISEDGDGYQILFGVKSLIHRSSQLGIGVNASYFIAREEIKYDQVKHEIESKELHLGATGTFLGLGKIQPYAGLELTLISDGEIKTTTPGGSGKGEFEKDDILDLRLGAKVPLGQIALKAEALLIGQTTLVFGADIAI